ncbi:peptidase S15 [Methylobacterium sp. 4-46]|uniref:CocE/NonD family hydrolase n=1 Tax=unclassified Methylobacterium TaxID=2615210 RepID=UPI000165CBCC|nr:MULTISPECIES: CocE/NonD family hydrolase [Methylobacterium]ACA19014.1 peptidase S15 [Methylobacterium sp. 4-46]WFT78228.1 CocE/NonD family hydrolase [Methylobacterium nodulans]
MSASTEADEAGSSAWRVAPGAYLEARPPCFAQPAAPESCYVTMRDGCRLALDLHLPRPLDGGSAPGSFPTILLFTPYYRRFKLRPGARGEANPNSGKFRDLFVPRGYAVVIVDVRGTGASFGTRDSFRSPKEREDSREITDWVVAQPWSNGRVGATGVSYLGAAADFLASTGHPAVKAIAPLFSVWDTYSDNYFPGGIALKELTRVYDELMVGLDHDRRDLLKNFVYYANPDFAGPQPVDEDPDGILLAQAIREHLGNFRQTEFMPEFRFREEPLPYDPGFSSASFSPYAVSDRIRPDVAVLSVSGWMDGAGYMNGAVSRFLTLDRNPRHLLLGPWDHGARIDVSPWRRSQEARFPYLGEVLRFFDHYLAERDTGLAAEAPVHVYAMHAEAWREAASWPPVAETTDLHLGAEARLLAEPGASGAAEHRVDFAAGTGRGTRYERIAGINSTEYYADWAGRTDRMLSFTSAPLAADRELIGHALADLWLSSSEPDAGLFVYLTEIEADGAERYVTEGLLRALHRAEAPAPERYRTTWPFRTFRRAQAAPLVPGRVERIRIPLLPTAWRFAAGSRIRVSLAGADADHCGQIPHGRPPLLRVHFGADAPSRIALPLARA